MIDRTDPDRPHVISARAADFHEQFETGKISAALYRAHLYSLGMRGAQIETEVGLHWTAKARP